MKFIFSTQSSKTLNHLWMLIFRVALGAFMLTHGLPKLNMLLSGSGGGFPDPLGVGNNISLILAVFGEVIAPVLVIIGFSSRFSAIPVAFTMAIAAFAVHSGDPFSRKELALLFMLGYLTIVVMGGGKYSFDSLLGNKR
jgi:putative oxidoreductase